MWQYQKLSMLLGLGLVTIATSTGCATNVEEPGSDEVAMSDENAAESAEALTAGGHGSYGFGKFGPKRGLALGRRFGRGFRGHGGHFIGGYGHGGYGHGDYGYGDYGYGDYGYGEYGYGEYGYGDYDDDRGDVVVIVEQNNGYDDYDNYDDYEDYIDYDDCGGPEFDDDWN